MTLKDLLKELALQGLDDSAYDLPVVLSSDPEGNRYSKLRVADHCNVVEADVGRGLEIFDEEYHSAQVCEKAEPAIVLWPEH